ncbi:MAG TPA: T9SS type A sorting domain-containing protein [Saprospiraceae bacterium]|nr:T9SS type A sorting domain-containing protein [Saprospiraceae bacterium]HMQ85269.1 T9SS type A sorting domain-containing protein [Saprospiraceae bacterium]
MKPFLFAIIIGIAIFSGALLPLSQKANAFHSDQELQLFHQMLLEPVDSNIIFPNASYCSGCHGYDSNHYALVDFFGNDVNIYDDWRTSMMANAAKDPFWRAKVSHEVYLNANYSEAIQTKCTSCHAPMGHYTALFRGHEFYTMEDLLQDTIGLDGVSCSACHMISEDRLGDLNSGEINYDTNRVLYGPYPQPFGAPMSEFVGFDPIYSEHVRDAGMCASCHTLITYPIGYDGELIGTSYIEQATYHEWLNSVYGEDQENVSCQACHMPTLEEAVVISANYLFLEGRSPFALHELAGANTFMLQLMKTYRAELDIDALPEHFDETIAATYAMLQEKSVQTELAWLGVEEDTAYFSLKLTNLAGHKFPSGYPSRRLFVEFLAITEAGDTLFHSGARNASHELIQEDQGAEPHYAVINDPAQVQIYELVAGDINNQFTVVLEHAYATLKDNRLPPAGFSTTHGVYDTTLIVGHALQDPNFNHTESGVEGSGSDVLFFHIPTQNYVGDVRIQANIWYHSLPPKWVKPIFEVETPEINTFEAMFNSMDNTPVLVASKMLDDVNFPLVEQVVRLPEGSIHFFPNPSRDGIVRWQTSTGITIQSIRVFDLHGKMLDQLPGQQNQVVLKTSGTYVLEVQTNRGMWVERIVVVGR